MTVAPPCIIYFRTNRSLLQNRRLIARLTFSNVMHCDSMCAETRAEEILSAYGKMNRSM